MVSRVIELNEETRAALADFAAKRKEFIKTRDEAQDELERLMKAERDLLTAVAKPEHYESNLNLNARENLTQDGKYLLVPTLPGVGEQS